MFAETRLQLIPMTLEQKANALQVLLANPLSQKFLR